MVVSVILTILLTDWSVQNMPPAPYANMPKAWKESLIFDLQTNTARSGPTLLQKYQPVASLVVKFALS